MTNRNWAALLPWLFCATTAYAEIYRCAGDPPRFQDAPCDSTGVAGLSAGAGSGVREAERDWLRARADVRFVAKPKKSRRSESAAAARRQEQRCWQKRQQLDRVKATLRHGYKPAQGERLRQSRKRYEDYLFRYCD